MSTIQTTIATAQDITKIFRPKADRVVVIRDTYKHTEVEEILNTAFQSKINVKSVQTDSGLHIPDVALKKINTGTIAHFGARVIGLHTGMRVLFGRNSGTDLEINDQKFVIMRMADLMLDLGTFEPFQDKVLIEPKEAPKMIKGIYIPDNVNEQPQIGDVVACGPECEETVEGEKVVFGKFAGMMLAIEKKEYIIMRESDIVAKLDEGEAEGNA